MVSSFLFRNILDLKPVSRDEPQERKINIGDKKNDQKREDGDRNGDDDDGDDDGDDDEDDVDDDDNLAGLMKRTFSAILWRSTKRSSNNFFKHCF